MNQHVHGTIAKMMAKYWDRQGQTPHMAKIMEAAGVRMENLPTIEKYVEQGRSILCYANCLGRCRHGQNCNFKHVSGSELGDKFATELCRAVGNGVAWWANQPPYQRVPYPDRPGSGQYGPAEDGGRGTKRKLN